MSPCSAWVRALGLSFGAGAFALAIGCGPATGDGGGYASPGGYSSGGGSSSSGGSSAGSTKPMLVVVDADRTMNASPGAGVGVFSEYRAGGHWHVWWTCDTNKTNQSCSFDVAVSVASGAITNVASVAFAAADSVSQASASVVDAVTTTTTSAQGVTFDAPAGATITIDAQMDGQRDGSFLFFVQDGKINGGYTGMLTDPLMLQPSAP